MSLRASASGRLKRALRRESDNGLERAASYFFFPSILKGKKPEMCRDKDTSPVYMFVRLDFADVFKVYFSQPAIYAGFAKGLDIEIAAMPPSFKTCSICSFVR